MLELCSPRSWNFFYFTNKIWFKRIYRQLVSVLRQSCVELIDTGTHSKEILNICASCQAREKLGWPRSPGATCVFLFIFLFLLLFFSLSSPSSLSSSFSFHFFFCTFGQHSPFSSTPNPLSLATTSLATTNTKKYLYLWVKKKIFFLKIQHISDIIQYLSLFDFFLFALVLPPLSVSSFFLYVLFINYPNKMTCCKGTGLAADATL